MVMKIAVLPGDGIGSEIVAEAVKVLQVLDLPLQMDEAKVGGAAFDAHGHPLPEHTLKLAMESDAVLFGAVGDWKYDKLERHLRPEQANMGLFANFRPAICYPQLTHASSLKPELVAGLDILIIRELTGDVYFGQPRGRRVAPDGEFKGAEEGFDTMRYTRPEIERIAHVAFQAARKRNKRVTSVDKANVLETSSSGKTSSPRCTSSTPTSSWTTCTWTTPRCSWSKPPRSSTCSLPATCLVTSCLTRRPC